MADFRDKQATEKKARCVRRFSRSGAGQGRSEAGNAEFLNSRLHRGSGMFCIRCSFANAVTIPKQPARRDTEVFYCWRQNEISFGATKRTNIEIILQICSGGTVSQHRQYPLTKIADYAL